MDITTIRTSGLGDNTYVAIHDGQAIIVDPQRDIDRFLDVLEYSKVELRYVLETHIHNDYVSGGRELAAHTGAELVIPASAAVPFDHLPAFHNEAVGRGTWILRPIHTPGHTPEHLSYLVEIEGEPFALFSGGSLLVGSAGRPDLLGMDRARTLAHLQYISVNRLAELPDEVGLYPTHGSGSFCTATAASSATSTIGAEKTSNPVLQYPDLESFIAGQLSGLQPYPAYYAHMGPTNLAGPQPGPNHDLVELAVADIGESAVVDIRPAPQFAGGHLAGAIGIPFGDQVGVWAGWVLPFNAEVVIVAERGQDIDEVRRQFSRIGFDRVRGVLFDLGDDTELVSYESVRLSEFMKRAQTGQVEQLVDVRQPSEWDEGHIEGSIHAYTPDLFDDVGRLDDSRPAWLICGTGHRATVATAALEKGGVTPVVLVGHGVTDVMRRGLVSLS
ncbi:MAG: MBL fold metallo-hydrolase [Acidimicrobiia bacterium]|nr:MBL fold metallo-hydrolase [Acidimicrobiia bacterium]MDX2467956.1 MBL fold metallo-hydrolase [Acidimicrobiia bacterium]